MDVNLNPAHSTNFSGQTGPVSQKPSTPPPSSPSETEAKPVENFSASSSLLEKRRHLDEEAEQVHAQVEALLPSQKKAKKQHLGPLQEKMVGCFPAAADVINSAGSVEKLREIAHLQAKEKLGSVAPVADHEIEQIYSLLFESDEFSKHSLESAVASTNLCSPHICQVYQTLHASLDKLQQYGSFADVLENKDKFLNEHPGLKSILKKNASVPQIVAALDKISSKDKQIERQQEYLDCPILDLKDLLSVNKRETYILRDNVGKPCWVFKPAMSTDTEAVAGLRRAKSEQMASLFNDKAGFPIPFTAFLNIKGTVGSMQMFIEGASTVIFTRRRSNLAQEAHRDLQKLFIFDLISGNSDRHTNNFLQSKAAGQTSLYGIDHGECFQSYREALVMNYTTHSALGGPHVSIAEDTGRVHVERLVAVDDSGTVVNPLILEAQIHGSAAHGLGEALIERMVYDADGYVLTGSLLDYAIPTAHMLPTFQTGHFSTPSPQQPFGAKGAGEAGNIGTPAAVVNAVLDALAPLGVTAVDHPLTDERIWRLMQSHR